jgi:hypothetical protein
VIWVGHGEDEKSIKYLVRKSQKKRTLDRLSRTKGDNIKIALQKQGVNDELD